MCFAAVKLRGRNAKKWELALETLRFVPLRIAL